MRTPHWQRMLNLPKPAADNPDQKIYTTSCAGKNPEDLPALLERLNAVLIDVRLNPQQATRLVWTRSYLELLIKKRYLHVPLLADRAAVKPAGDSAPASTAPAADVTNAEEVLPAPQPKPSIQNLQLGMRVVKALQIDAVIMCDCPRDQNCHRYLIGEVFRKENYDVRDLETWLSPAPTNSIDA